MVLSRIKRAIAFTQMALLTAAGSAYAVTVKTPVADEGANTVSVVNTGAQRFVQAIPVSAMLQGMRIGAKRMQVWVANLKGGSVSVIAAGSQKQIAQVAVGKGPSGIGMSP